MLILARADVEYEAFPEVAVEFMSVAESRAKISYKNIYFLVKSYSM